MIVIAIILLVIVGILAFLNMGIVPLNLYFATFEVPLWLLFVGLLLIGMVIAALFASSKGARNRQIIKNKNEELKNAETSRNEAVDRVTKESEAQLEIQKKETEIQKLNARLTSLEENQSNQEDSSSQVISSEDTLDAQKNKSINKNKDIHVEEYQVDLDKNRKPKN